MRELWSIFWARCASTALFGQALALAWFNLVYIAALYALVGVVIELTFGPSPERD